MEVGTSNATGPGPEVAEVLPSRTEFSPRAFLQMIEIKEFISENGQPSPEYIYVSQKQSLYTIKTQTHFSQSGHKGN